MVVAVVEGFLDAVVDEVEEVVEELGGAPFRFFGGMVRR